MGTVFTLDIRDPGDWSAAVAEAVAWLHHVDAVFSTYRPDSDLSRVRRGELRVADADPAFEPVLDLCARARTDTGGAFSAMSGGGLDPTGVVKGWAIERASDILDRHGARNHAVNGGGDMQLAGQAEPDRPWGVGIADPADPTRVLTIVRGCDLAVATSGVAERGLHIVDPFTGRPATGIASATVLGPRLALVDAYATAAVVLGRDAVRWIDTMAGYAALVVTTEGEQLTSAGWAAHVDG